MKYWEARDPLPRYQEWLLSEGLISIEELDQINASVDDEVVAAAEFAANSPFPAAEDLYLGVYQK